MNFRIGSGYDIHRLVEGRKLILGGVEIPHHFGLLGHSDADVLIHAIIDAMLGSIALGDIGQHFPPSDTRYKDIDSKQLLKISAEKLNQAGYKINNIDSTIIAEKPKLAKYILPIRQQLANVLKIEIDQISVKAKTAEGLGEIGKESAIVSKAVILVEKTS